MGQERGWKEGGSFERLTQQPSQGERVGGLSHHVIREVFDRVDFRTENGGSVIKLVKMIG